MAAPSSGPRVATTQSPSGSAAAPELSLAVRLYRENYFHSGCEIWDAAIALARWLTLQPRLLEGKRVLELSMSGARQRAEVRLDEVGERPAPLRWGGAKLWLCVSLRGNTRTLTISEQRQATAPVEHHARTDLLHAVALLVALAVRVVH